jgi:hypothetical protein
MGERAALQKKLKQKLAAKRAYRSSGAGTPLASSSQAEQTALQLAGDDPQLLQMACSLLRDKPLSNPFGAMSRRWADEMDGSKNLARKAKEDNEDNEDNEEEEGPPPLRELQEGGRHKQVLDRDPDPEGDELLPGEEERLIENGGGGDKPEGKGEEGGDEG